MKLSMATQIVYKRPSTLNQYFFSEDQANINMETKKKEFLNKTHKAAYNSIISKIFETICPIFWDNPKQAFTQIKQVNRDVRLTATQYFNTTMTLLNNFKMGYSTNWQNDLVTHWVNNLLSSIRIKMEEAKYANHLGGVSTKPYDQLKTLREIIKR